MARVLSVLIPCYNEAATIAEIVARVEASPLPEGWTKQIIVVDDASAPETHEVLATLPAHVTVIYRQKNGGKGAAVKEGLRHITGDYCIIQDADLELDPGQYGDLLRPIVDSQAEAVFGYRTIPAEAHRQSPLLFLGGKVVTWLYNLCFFTRFKDIPCGFKLFPARCIPTLLATPSEDFVFDAIEMTRVISKECRVTQVAVTYAPRTREQGKKLFIRHGLYCVLATLLMRIGLHHKPLDVEVPRLFRYELTGVLTVGINLMVLYVATDWFHIWYVASSVIGFVVSYAINFSLHKFWTFESKEIKHAKTQLPLHLSLALINLVLNAVLLYALVEYLHIWYLGAQIITALFIAAESFILLSRFVFKDPAHD